MIHTMKPRPMTPELLAWLRAECLGKAGHADAESYVQWEKRDRDHVEFLTTGRGSGAVAVLDRCGSQVVEFASDGEGQVWLKIRTATDEGKRVFRGMAYCFAPIDNSRSGSFPGGDS